jgi:hypothetical protein
MLRKDVKSQLFSTGMLISLLLGLVLLVEPQYQYFLYFARWDNKADYINFFFSSLALGGYLIFTPIITVMPGVFRFCDEYKQRIPALYARALEEPQKVYVHKAFFKRCLRRRGERSAACGVCADNAHFLRPVCPERTLENSD